ncbi:MAG: G2-specific serine/threonine protein kinase [Chrysothrix sp. TS-e1954]|nr:MAG: G2-specific serine/threonine protein kinase [Chrysothrix sp. TS-e1954]
MSEVEKYEVLEKIGKEYLYSLVLCQAQEQLGHGSFGIIRKVRRKSDGYVLCRKEISYLQMSSKEREQLQSELSILKGLRHPNIVAYYEREHMKASSDLHIYMEFCEHGDLGKYIRELKGTKKTADEDFVWSVFTQLVTALYRCHYGEDPPEVGRNVIGLSSDAKPLRSKASHAMILHRDLKPENIFLGADASVKLGDFGLSKIMQSHDFASTYVGTPFYMSPEICAAEQYSLHSDIWAFGCIMYELCSKEPPFNARTHLELIQKIRLGKITPLSPIYSTELKDSIAKCLRVNPSTRPDTVQLLNIPMVKLKRKELEIVRVGRQLKTKEEQVTRTLKDAERRLAHADAERERIRVDIDNAVRREWEVKARLEIDRQVQLEKEKLCHDFEAEVTRQVAEMRQRERDIRPEQIPLGSSSPLMDSLAAGDSLARHQQSQSTTGEPEDFPSSTDLSELSLESPTLKKSFPKFKTGRTPFARAHTTFEGSPMDVAMADPSPAPIGSLGLSPRHKASKPSQLSSNIFSAMAKKSDAEPGTIQDGTDEIEDITHDDNDDTDDLPVLPSPTRNRIQNADPFKVPDSRRPPLMRQKTAPMRKQTSQTSLFVPATKSQMPHDVNSAMAVPSQTSQTPQLPASPSRRISKLPSASSLLSHDVAGPNRKAPAPPLSPNKNAFGVRPPSRRREDDVRQATVSSKTSQTQPSQVQGRTLIELAQTRTAAGIAVQDFGDDLRNEPKGKAPKSASWDRPPEMFPAVWNPDQDEMPSPFLAKVGRGLTAGALGGPGMRHLR